MLNMFRAFLCPSSGAIDYKYVLVAYGVQCLAAGCRGSGAVQQGVRPGRGMLQHLLAAGCRRSGAVQQGVRSGRGMPQHPLTAGCLGSGAAQQGVCVQEVGCCSIPLLTANPDHLHLTPENQQSSTAHHRRKIHTYSLELLMMGIEVPETC